MILYKSKDPFIDSYNIIVMSKNSKSVQYAERCMESCKRVGVKNVEYFEAVDGATKQGDILYPFPNNEIPIRLSGVKVTNSKISQSEVACFLSHFLLWQKCIITDRPLIVLEHDALLLRPYDKMDFPNCIVYLGNEHYKEEEYRDPYYESPYCRHSDPNNPYIDRTHAYAIDPFVARRLVAKVISHGICTAVDAFMSFNDFCIVQPVPYIATIDAGETTIQHSG